MTDPMNVVLMFMCLAAAVVLLMPHWRSPWPEKRKSYATRLLRRLTQRRMPRTAATDFLPVPVDERDPEFADAASEERPEPDFAAIDYELRIKRLEAEAEQAVAESQTNLVFGSGLPTG